MINYILLASSVLLGSFKNIFTKKVKNKSNDFFGVSKANLFLFAIAFLVVYIFYFIKNGFVINAPILISFCYAIFTLLAQISLFVAVGSGPVAVSSLFYSCGFILPTIYGIIAYNEQVNVLQIIGISLILVSFVLATQFTGKGKLNFKWLLSALGGLIFSGLVGICQKIFVKEYTTYSLDGFLCLSFLIMIFLSAIMLGVCVAFNKKKPKPTKEKNLKIFVISSLVLGVIIGLANKLNTYLSGVFISAVSFPTINGGTIIFTALMSAVLLKEKLSVKQWIGIIIGFLAILLIALA